MIFYKLSSRNVFIEAQEEMYEKYDLETKRTERRDKYRGYSFTVSGPSTEHPRRHQLVLKANV